MEAAPPQPEAGPGPRAVAAGTQRELEGEELWKLIDGQESDSADAPLASEGTSVERLQSQSPGLRAGASSASISAQVPTESAPSDSGTPAELVANAPDPTASSLSGSAFSSWSKDDLKLLCAAVKGSRNVTTYPGAPDDPRPVKTYLREAKIPWTAVVAAHFPGRSVEDCREAWRQTNPSGRNPGTGQAVWPVWTAGEEDLLREDVLANGPVFFKLIQDITADELTLLDREAPETSAPLTDPRWTELEARLGYRAYDLRKLMKQRRPTEKPSPLPTEMTETKWKQVCAAFKGRDWVECRAQYEKGFYEAHPHICGSSLLSICTGLY
ncbi:hypothetical protein RQP46_010942 [Phenoliferia psychrophenolica]